MFNHVFVPLDGSQLAETVLPHVVAVVLAFDARVTLGQVLDPSNENRERPPVDPLEWQIRKAEAEAYLESVSTRLEKTGLKPGVISLEGQAAETIIEFSEENDVDLIIMSSHGQSGLSGWNVSSVVQKVILRARTSVMIERAYFPFQGELADLRYRRILLPLDGSRRAEAPLPALVALARYHNSELIIAHVVRRPEIPRRIPLSQDDLELVERIVERNRAEAARYLEEVQARLDVKVETRLIVSDRVTRALEELVELAGVDLVMLSAHGYSGGGKWPYGSTVISFIAYGVTPLFIFQDLPKHHLEPSKAEQVSREYGRR